MPDESTYQFTIDVAVDAQALAARAAELDIPPDPLEWDATDVVKAVQGSVADFSLEFHRVERLD